MKERGTGFTLLEVMVALAILSVALLSISNLNSGAVAMHSYGKKLTVATFLARSKMLDIEQKLNDEGLPAADRDESGSFDDEGFPAIKWRADILKPKTEGLGADQMIGLLFGGDEDNPLSALFGGGKDKGDASSALSAMLGGLGGAGAKGAAGALGGAGGLGGAAAGMLAGAVQGQVQMMMNQINKTVREVRLKVWWMEGKSKEEFTVVTHVISLGPTGTPTVTPPVP